MSSDYTNKYHFLEGLSNYENWNNLINYETKNLRFKRNSAEWPEKALLMSRFEKITEFFKDSTIVFSYKSPGKPSEEEIVSLIGKYKNEVSVEHIPYHYALNKLNGKPDQNIELLIIGR